MTIRVLFFYQHVDFWKMFFLPLKYDIIRCSEEKNYFFNKTPKNPSFYFILHPLCKGKKLNFTFMGIIGTAKEHRFQNC